MLTFLYSCSNIMVEEILKEEIIMGDMVIRLEGYKTVMHIHYTAEGHYIVTEGAHILNISGITYKDVVQKVRRAIKRRGQSLRVRTLRARSVRMSSSEEHMFFQGRSGEHTFAIARAITKTISLSAPRSGPYFSALKY